MCQKNNNDIQFCSFISTSLLPIIVPYIFVYITTFLLIIQPFSFFIAQFLGCSSLEILPSAYKKASLREGGGAAIGGDGGSLGVHRSPSASLV